MSVLSPARIVLPSTGILMIAVLFLGSPGDRSQQARTHAQEAKQQLPMLERLPAPSVVPARAIVNSIGLRLGWIPEGSFLMGSPAKEEDRPFSESPQHKVRITRGFYLGVFEVTQGEYEAVIGSNPATFKLGASHPVEQVTWEQAVAFCEKLSARNEEKLARRTYRLPTEAEWEYACRAGTTSPYHTGDDLTEKQANWRGLGRTTKVGSFAPNVFGLYDMHGNVWEWCQDWYNGGHYREARADDPVGPQEGDTRVIRGGGWDDPVTQCRSAMRESYSPNNRIYDIGFRVVCVFVEP